jgi:HK97 gp10 family phage protein
MAKFVKLTGFRDLEKALSELPKSTGKAVLRRVGKKALEPMQAKAKALSPKDTGLLRWSIVISQKRTRRVPKTRGPISGIQMAMGPSAGEGVLNYAALDEFGTVHAEPHPYMRPAWDSEAEGALNSIKADLGTEIDKSAKRLARKRAKG